MKVLVCGGRSYKDRNRAFAELDRLEPLDGSLEIITGSANGADQLAWEWFLARKDFGQIGFQTYPANWKEHGKAAGPIRNQKMLDEGKPDLVVAFPGGRGTADMVRRAEAAGVRVQRVGEDITKLAEGAGS